MAAVLSLFLFSVALIMLLIMKIEIDLAYKKRFKVVFNIGIIAVELYDRVKSDKSAKQKKSKPESKRVKLLRTKIIFNSILELIEDCEVTIGELSLPSLTNDEDFHKKYQLDALYASLFSILIAYLSTKAQKLYQKENALTISAPSDAAAVHLSFGTALIKILIILLRMKKKLDRLERASKEAGN